jgi:hypothetical protein
MMTINGIVSVLSLSFVLAGVCLADDLAPTFEEAAARGDAQERAAATKDYFTKTLMPYFGQKYAPVLQSCFSSVPKPDNSRFSFVAAIGIDGRVLRLYRDRETNIFQCMHDTLEKDQFPAPPVTPYYLHVEMNFTGEDAPQAGPQKDAPPLVVEPNKYSCTFAVPKGWEYSFDQGKEFGVPLVFFPKGGSFRNSKTIIYVNEINEFCVPNCAGAIPRAIDHEMEQSRADSPSLKVTIGTPLKIQAGGQAAVRILTGLRDPHQVKEALAFIEHNETIVLLVLTTGDTKTWEQDYALFTEIVSGHKFFTCNSPDLAVNCKQ